MKLLAIGLVIFAAMAQSKLDTQINTSDSLATTTVPTIALANAKQIQTVLMSTQRLNPDEKLAMYLTQAHNQQANVQLNKKLRKIA